MSSSTSQLQKTTRRLEAYITEHAGGAGLLTEVALMTPSPPVIQYLSSSSLRPRSVVDILDGDSASIAGRRGKVSKELHLREQTRPR